MNILKVHRCRSLESGTLNGAPGRRKDSVGFCNKLRKICLRYLFHFVQPLYGRNIAGTAYSQSLESLSKDLTLLNSNK